MLLTDPMSAELAVSIGDKVRQARVLIHFGYVENMLGDNPLAKQLAEQARALALEIKDHYLVVESQILAAQTASYSGKPAEVCELLLPHMNYQLLALVATIY